MTVMHDGVTLGEYFVDLLAEDALLVEVKVAKALDDSHRLQCINYPKATGLQLCPFLDVTRYRPRVKHMAQGLRRHEP